MISATSFRWYFVPLFFLSLRLIRPVWFLLSGPFALAWKAAGCFVSILVWIFGFLINAFGIVNTVLALAVCFSFFWLYLKVANSGVLDPSSLHDHQPNGVLEDAPDEIPDVPDLEEELDHSDPLPEPIPARSRKHKKSKRRGSSKGEVSATTPPTTETGTPSVGTSEWTSKKGYGHGYGQPLVPPVTSANWYCDNSLYRSRRKNPHAFSYRSFAISHAIVHRLAAKSPPLPIPTSPLVEGSEPVPVPAPQAPPSPAQAQEDGTAPAFPPPDKSRRVSKKGRSSAPYQRPRQSNRTSRQPTLSLSGLSKVTPSPLPSARHAYSPMIVEAGYDESLVLADRLELLSISSAPPSPLLVKMASPIIDQGACDVGWRELALECDEEDSDCSDESMDVDGSEFGDSDSNYMDLGSFPMDVDPIPVEFDVDMDAWDHPPVESPLLGNTYAPSLRYQFTGLSLEEDHDMLVDACST
ncbi:hypothetical protein EYR40_005732 [Pleurotus pulmonarius]|nr:hypothetical protein EYR40_005732 [Pleurotus pulmonarius]